MTTGLNWPKYGMELLLRAVRSRTNSVSDANPDRVDPADQARFCGEKH
jgi:hypothetical protein